MSGRYFLGLARASAIALIVGLGWLSIPSPALSAAKHPAASVKKPFAYDTDGVVSIAADPLRSQARRSFSSRA